MFDTGIPILFKPACVCLCVLWDSCTSVVVLLWVDIRFLSPNLIWKGVSGLFLGWDSTILELVSKSRRS